MKAKNKSVCCLILLVFFADAAWASSEGVPDNPQDSGATGAVFVATERLADGTSISLESAYVRARATAWLRALDEAAVKLSARYDLRLSELSRNDKRALAAQTYITTIQPPDPSVDLPHVIVILQPRRSLAAEIAFALQRPELLRFWNMIIEELRANLPENSASGAMEGRSASDSVFVAPVPSANKPNKTDMLAGIWLIRDAVSPTQKGLLIKAESLPFLEKAVNLAPQSAVVRLALAEAQLQQDLPEQCVHSCDQALNLAPDLYRALFIRALALMRLRRLALAENDLNTFITVGLPATDKEMAERLRTRGALRLLRGKNQAMCEDFFAACGFGDCEGLAEVRSQGYCASQKEQP